MLGGNEGLTLNSCTDIWDLAFLYMNGSLLLLTLPVVKWLTSSSGLYNKSPQSSLHPMNRTPPRTPASLGDLDGITLLPFRTVATHLQVFHDIIMGSQTAVLSKGLDTPSVDDVSIDHH